MLELRCVEWALHIHLHRVGDQHELRSGWPILPRFLSLTIPWVPDLVRGACVRGTKGMGNSAGTQASTPVIPPLNCLFSSVNSLIPQPRLRFTHKYSRPTPLPCVIIC